MSPLLLAVVAGLGVGGLIVAGVLGVALVDGGLEVVVGRGSGRRKFVLDSREGLVADVALLLLVLTTASLVVGSHWVAGTDVLVPVMVTGALVCLLLAKLAPRGTTYWLAVEVSAVVAMFVYTAHHGAGVVEDTVTWVTSARGSVAQAALLAMAGAGWMVVGWCAFWVARRRSATLALAPLAVLLAVQVLNDPAEVGGGLLLVAWIALAGVLLLRLNTARIRERWQDMADSHVWIYIASRGAIAVTALLVISILLPPLSTVDLSVGLFRGRSPSPGTVPSGEGAVPLPDPRGGGSLAQIGYSERVTPGGTLARSVTPVLRVSSDFGRPVYWRGINLYQSVDGSWTPGPARAVTAAAVANVLLDDGLVRARQHVHASVEVLAQPQQTIFWPGEPVQVNQASSLRSSRTGGLAGVASVESAYTRAPLPPGTTYMVEAVQSVASEEELRLAGSAYPASVLEITGGTAAARAIAPEVRDLAAQVTGTQVTAYDRVKAVESYLRTRERYSLTVDSPPPGIDPVGHFLFTSHVGYCEYFASSMGQMVRALGIPVRLVSGYGPGQPVANQDVGHNFRHDTALGSSVNTIRAADAHTWVEVYFPGYGWIPFEPTPDPNYPALAHGDASAVRPPAPVPAAPAVPEVPRPTTVPGQTAARVPVLAGIGVAALAIALVLLVTLGSRAALGSPSGAGTEFSWRRIDLVGRRLRLRRRPSDTPLEYGHRLSQRIPGLGVEIMTLAAAYSRERYAAGSRPSNAGDGESAAWAAVRARLLSILVLGGRAPVVRAGAVTPPS